MHLTVVFQFELANSRLEIGFELGKKLEPVDYNRS